ncbi:MFS transporter [Adhaeribacter pallidiroseus]|uniref:Putative MFS-type transporter YceJ n=1 Tax=Adhaeribacter pallidiroseus TaxID=2072847 RepID=A0A369QGE1_9BACT|nr:MFS transporter [Adhaeribacter pallidiroseus]RDC64001.1 putative MFS-type transporter YceJ [Adhaeribacter pallidiroseus]
MNRIFSVYRNAFSGLSPAAWMLALVMLINRTGAMVLPFLSIYLTEVLHFTVQQVGFTLSLFGLGSMCGSFLGGWLTDKFGHFSVQVMSLIGSGLFFFLLLPLKTFLTFAPGLFMLSLIAECLRPANAASVSFYTRGANITRAFSLNRMAINLGFSIGPVLGGILATFSYHWLFLADGFTSLAAGLFFYLYFRRRQGHAPAPQPNQAATSQNNSPYRDRKYVWYAVLSGCFGIIFFQFFSNLPLYYRQVYALPRTDIGLLFALNGFVVFSMEMILVYLLGTRFKLAYLVSAGTLLVGFSFVTLNWFQGVWILYLSMFLLSLAEILAMPFMATVPVQRSGPGNRGAYMGLFNLSYSVAFVVGPYLGSSIITHFGFPILWGFTATLATLTALGFWFLIPKMEKQAESKSVAG